MLALIDIGNSSIALSISLTGDKIDKVYRINTEKSKSSDEYALILNELFESVDKAVISSVVPELNDVFKDYFFRRFGIIPIFLGMGVKTGIKINSDNPKEVGGDLIANAVAATELYNPTCLIIDLGTATTFTYVENCNLKGVIIAPGLTTSRNALITKTSLLPQVELEAPTKLLGTTSSDCIKSGLIYGHASMIDGMILRIKNKVNNPNLLVVITGGHAKLIYPHCLEKMIIDELLILKGLLLVEKRNSVKKN
ncbi:MAG: type III pantothenate kinase [Firmicutes bacterium]|nr:type III pantothenate kinase [Bacillota bacterium]